MIAGGDIVGGHPASRGGGHALSRAAGAGQDDAVPTCECTTPNFSRIQFTQD